MNIYSQFIRTCTHPLVVLALAASFLTAGCSKADQTYVKYKNTAGAFNGNAIEYLQSQPGLYDSMLLVINRLPGIADSLRTGSYTVFATSNRAYAIALKNINDARRDSVPALPPVSFSTMDESVLDSFFCRYIIPGNIRTLELYDRADGLELPSMKYGYKMQLQLRATNASGFLGGGPLAILLSDRRRSEFAINWVSVYTNTVDIKTSNATVHILDPGHNFGFGTDLIQALNRD